MTYGPCVDCKATHKCGVKCSSMKCFDDKCSCLAKEKEIADGLYLCDNCQLIIPANAKSFEVYFDNAIEWYNDFSVKHKTRLHDLEQNELCGILIDEKETGILEVIKAFYREKSNFSKYIPATLQLDTILSRKNAYAFVKAFNALKNIEF